MLERFADAILWLSVNDALLNAIWRYGCALRRAANAIFAVDLPAVLNFKKVE